MATSASATSGTSCDDPRRDVGGTSYQVGIDRQIGDAELLLAGLTRAEHIARAALLEIFLGDAEAVAASRA